MITDKKFKEITTTRKVFRISVKGEFKQYLALGEAVWLSKMAQDFGEITVECVLISIAEWNRMMGR